MVQEIIHNVISVHAEVERVSPRNSNQVKDAMLRIVQAVTEEVNRLLACISRMNSNGCIQVRIHSIFLDHKCSKVYFILYLMKFKYVPLLAQHLGMCNI